MHCVTFQTAPDLAYEQIIKILQTRFLNSSSIGETVTTSPDFFKVIFTFCVIKIKHRQHEFHNVLVKHINKYPSFCFKARKIEVLESHSLFFAMM